MSRCDLATWCLCEGCEDRRYSELLGHIVRCEIKYQLKINALIPHELNCDIWSCKKEICFKQEADKIIGEPYEWHP